MSRARMAECVQIPIRVLRQCLRFALYLSSVSRNSAGARRQPSEGIPNSVAGSKANPLRDRSVLLLRARKLLLGTEGFVALWAEECKQTFWCRGGREKGVQRGSEPAS